VRVSRAVGALLVLVVVAGVLSVGVLGGDEPRVRPTFSAVPAAVPPYRPQAAGVTSSWFCAGVPTGGEGFGGRVVVVNPADSEITGRLTVFTDAGQPPVEERFTIAARGQQSFNLAELQPAGTFLGSLVEIDGGGGAVEQEAITPAGRAVAPCTLKASSEWYFADGFTVADSTARLVLTNPYPDPAVVEIEFATPSGPLQYAGFRSFIVPGYSVKVVTEEFFMPRDEAVFATKVISARGRIVVGRAQTYNGGGRGGFTMTLGAPSLTTQYYFADGERAADGSIAESYNLYNPTDLPVTVEVVVLGVGAEFAYDAPIEVPAGEVVTLNLADIADLPEGRHGILFNTFVAPSLVIERAITRPAGEGLATSVALGVPGTFAQLLNRWTVTIGPDEPRDGALVVFAPAARGETVTVSALASGGVAPVPGLEEVPLPTNGILVLDVTDASALGVPLIVESAADIYVERLLARGDGLSGASGSFALPG
jgi:hypothetical protein